MNTEQVDRRTKRRASTQRLFTVASASRALVYVRPIVQDIVDEYARLDRWREERRELKTERLNSRRVDELQTLLERAVERLTALHHEVAAVGCELKDWEVGLVDFPSIHNGNRVCLCWRLGEPEITHWHERDAGMAGRQPLPPDFE